MKVFLAIGFSHQPLLTETKILVLVEDILKVMPYIKEHYEGYYYEDSEWTITDVDTNQEKLIYLSSKIGE